MNEKIRQAVEFEEIIDNDMIANYKNKRNEFKRLFKGTDAEKSILIGDYSCAFHSGSPKILQQGRLYLTTDYLCFYSKIIIEQKVVIHFSEIQDITKEKTALVFPNAIQVWRKDQTKYFFASFTARDRTFQIFEKLWLEFSANIEIPLPVLWDRIRDGYGNELGFTLSDPEYEESKASQFNAVFRKFRRPSEVVGSSSQESLYESVDETANTSKQEARILKSPTSLQIPGFNSLNGLNGSQADSGTDDMSSEASSCNYGSSYPLNNRKTLGSTSRRTLSAAANFSQIEPSTSQNSEIQFGIQYRRVSRDLNSDGRMINGDVSPAQLSKPQTTNKKSYSPSHSLSSIDEDTKKTGEARIKLREPAQCDDNHEHFPNKTIDCAIDLNVKDVFELMYSDNEFYRTLCHQRGLSDLNLSDWVDDVDAEEQNAFLKKREISYTANLKNRIGPKRTPTVETQMLLKDSIDGYKYIIESIIQNKEVPLSDCFHFNLRYCMLYINPTKTYIKSFFKIVYDKSVMFPAKSIIESAVRNGCTEHSKDLKIALVREAKKRKQASFMNVDASSENVLNGASPHHHSLRPSIEDKYNDENLPDDEDEDNEELSMNQSFSAAFMRRSRRMSENVHMTSWIFMVIGCLVSFLILYWVNQKYTNIDIPPNPSNYPYGNDHPIDYNDPSNENNKKPLDNSLEELINVVKELKTVVQMLHTNMEKLSNAHSNASKTANISISDTRNHSIPPS